MRPSLILSRINPWHSLFGKIFLWFWLTSIIIIAITTFVVKTINQPYQLDQPTDGQMVVLVNQARRITQLYTVLGAEAFSQLHFINERERTQLYLVDEDLRIIGTPRPPRGVFPLLSVMLDQTQPTLGFWRREVWLGPVKLQLGDQYYYLLLRGIPDSSQVKLDRFYNESLILSVALLMSGLFSAVLAWSFSRPLKQFRRAAQQFASGNLSSRVGIKMTGRLDEFGTLGRDFDDMAERLEKLVHAQQRLLGNVSHELRSPITRIQVALGIAYQKAGPDAEGILTRIERESEKLEEMIAQVLRLSRLENQLQDLQKINISLIPLLEQLVDDANFEASASNKGVILDAPHQIIVCGEANLLHSAIENVVRNAIRYTREETNVEVITRSLSIGKCNKVEIVIRDYGPGASEETLKHLFEPFYRAVENTSDGGAGLGLSIAKQVITRHGGTINARNHINGGLEVVIHLESCKIDPHTLVKDETKSTHSDSDKEGHHET